MQVGFQLCEAGQAAAVAGTLGVAAGWHTLSYAILNDFPPIAVFSAIAAFGVALLLMEPPIERYHDSRHGFEN